MITYAGPVTDGALVYYLGQDDGVENQPNTLRVEPAAYVESLAAETAYLATLTTVVVERFEPPDFAPLDTRPFTLTGFASLGDVVIDTLSGGGPTIRDSGNISNPIPVGRYAAWGPLGETTSTVLWQFMEASNEFKITFENPARALGFWGVDIGDFETGLVLKFYFTDLTTQEFTLPITLSAAGLLPNNSSVLFFGALTTKEFDRVDFLREGGGSSAIDVFGFDQFYASATADVDDPPQEEEDEEPTDCGATLVVNACPQVCTLTVPTATIVSPTGVGTWAVLGGLGATCGATLVTNACAGAC